MRCLGQGGLRTLIPSGPVWGEGVRRGRRYPQHRQSGVGVRAWTETGIESKPCCAAEKMSCVCARTKMIEAAPERWSKKLDGSGNPNNSNDLRIEGGWASEPTEPGALSLGSGGEGP